jgi:hypothetical protein
MDGDCGASWINRRGIGTGARPVEPKYLVIPGRLALTWPIKSNKFTATSAWHLDAMA